MSPDVLCDLPLAFQPVAFRIKRASEAWERRDAHALRRAVFCVEQGIFVGDDRDAIDDTAQLLVACTSLAGECDQVVGTVRIHEAEPGVWWAPGGAPVVQARGPHRGHLDPAGRVFGAGAGRTHLLGPCAAGQRAAVRAPALAQPGRCQPARSPARAHAGRLA